ncbi:hypothetical protein [Nannocystis punicea]|uniref:Uncharacterized protein n=1 Tax=Nannocystis punicea TaxID=2995304 RepID=A0ABY7H932_9BACT|nr:hypothetical protein [Nannocystis poenicansa]WAS95539.1 hypothetical protein O0S08_05200 [Nannocystis poenicansa]
MASHTRFSGALAAIFLLSLPACGDSTATTTATTVATTESSGPNTGTETSPPDTTTTTTATTEAVTTSASTGPTSTTATTAPETSTGPATETTAASATTSETSGETTAVTSETSGETTTAGETSEGTTGEPMGATCQQDSDCQIYTDCCTCDVIAVGEQPPACDVPECFVEVCGTYDLSPQPPVCRFGRCTFADVTCNPTGVTCDEPPPDCGPGTLPSVAGECWTGKCAPVEACNWAPDCEACTTDPDPLVCVLKAQKGAYHVCEPKPVACGDAPEIDCECGQEICDALPPHTECHDQTPGIVCECPFC